MAPFTLHLDETGFRAVWEALNQFVDNQDETDDGSEPAEVPAARKLIEQMDAAVAAQAEPPMKACHDCKRKSIKGWVCRGCGARCCAHLCGLKDGETAMCGKCRLEGSKR